MIKENRLNRLVALRSWLISLILCIALTPANAQDKGIRFEKGDYASVLDKAKAENKLVFIDAFTTWCGPCKWMADNAFPDEKIGKFFNANFVNAKIDMEKGEGINLRKRYGVHAFPTYLFVNGEGELVHRFVGSMGLDDFVKGAEKALNPDQQYYTLSRQYQAGERGAEFLYKIAYSAKEAGADSLANVYADSYLKTQQDWLSRKNLTLINGFCTSVKEARYAFMRAHPSEFKALLGTQEYVQKLYELAYRGADEQVGLNSELKKGLEKHCLAKAKRYFHEILPEQEGKLIGRYAIKVYAVTKNLDGYAKATIAYYRAFPSSDADELNGVAWNFYETVEKKKYLKQALAWALRSTDLSKGYGNMDTVANLYAKLGDQQEAKVYSQKAIALGKSTGADTSTTEKLLTALK